MVNLLNVPVCYKQQLNHMESTDSDHITEVSAEWMAEAVENAI